VLILDEPFNGMDPEGIVWMRGFLRGLAAEGRAVFVSSHLMSELQDTADHLVVVGRGKVIADAAVKDMIAAASDDRVELRTAARAEAMTVLAHAGAEVAATAPDVLTIKGLSAERTVAALTANRVPFTEVSAHRATLEEAYMELTRDAVEYRAAPAVPSGQAPSAAPGPAPSAEPGQAPFANPGQPRSTTPGQAPSARPGGTL
jgi:ABC-2 type transport system ATP-binding protein